MSDACPKRSHLDDAAIKWRMGKPDYSMINEKYLKEKWNNHKADSMEKLVEDLVKTWEAESTHKVRAEDWQTVDPEKFTICHNGGRKFTLKDNIERGNYNMFLIDCPLYNVTKQTNESSHDLFRKAFKSGFAWELLKLYSGPPDVTFTWRHWGTFEGKYGDSKVKPTGEVIQMFGSCVVKVNENLKVECIEVFYDPNPMMATLTGFKVQ